MLKAHRQVLAAVQEANGYMVKALEIEQTLGAAPSMVASRGAMECDMVEYIMDKMPKAVKDMTSLAIISKTYLDNILPNMSAPSTVVVLPTEPSNVIFDPTANVAQQSFANYGWKLGSIVAPKEADPAKPKADVQFEIAVVNDDGTVGLHPISADGTVDKVYMRLSFFSNLIFLLCFPLFSLC